MVKSEFDNIDSTESLIESLHATRRRCSLIVNPDYLKLLRVFPCSNTNLNEVSRVRGVWWCPRLMGEVRNRLHGEEGYEQNPARRPVFVLRTVASFLALLRGELR